MGGAFDVIEGEIVGQEGKIPWLARSRRQPESPPWRRVGMTLTRQCGGSVMKGLRRRASHGWR